MSGSFDRRWAQVVPPLGCAIAAVGLWAPVGAWFALPMAAALLAGVLAAVHHAEVVAHRVGEPYGTLLLAVAVTVIEVALIVSLMLAGGAATAALARDTVFAAVMLIVNGIIGLCLVAGGSRFGEQHYGQYGVSASLATLATITVLTLVLPNYTLTVAGPYYSASQLAFVAAVSLVLYATFVLVQTVRHRDYFLDPGNADPDAHAPPPANAVAALSMVLLMVCLVLVVVLAKALAPGIERAVSAAGAPKALVGVIIAAVVLLPEGLAALRAARADRLQTSLNLALGSALATIGLTIPVVAIVALAAGMTLQLGIDAKSTVLLLLSLLVATLSLSTGRTTLLQGAVHLVLLAVYLFTTVVP